MDKQRRSRSKWHPQLCLVGTESEHVSEAISTWSFLCYDCHLWKRVVATCHFVVSHKCPFSHLKSLLGPCHHILSPAHQNLHAGNWCLSSNTCCSLCANMAPTVVIVVNTHQRHIGIDRKGVSIWCWPCKHMQAAKTLGSVPTCSISNTAIRKLKCCLRICPNIHTKRMRSWNLGIKRLKLSLDCLKGPQKWETMM